VFYFDLEVSDLCVELDICATFLVYSSLNVEILLLVTHLECLELTQFGDKTIHLALKSLYFAAAIRQMLLLLFEFVGFMFNGTIEFFCVVNAFADFELKCF
jgi:hypothetical protein